ncbi:hypothetical protein GPECTOR_21g624 [Gonium pectorale]|uniref:TFIIS N-terminal domain-containing protein n=1 Tax=Gonium pectorale TaxID=33097 RepID=A0A150GHS7_GONPE|nr:hypothetical protein GPECTOR_21g624 [Gonium pectorale]|eukprot:KXZ49398.1 hypothetical protein GPECTOR_21g624 [Gonium pectorale]
MATEPIAAKPQANGGPDLPAAGGSGPGAHQAQMNGPAAGAAAPGGAAGAASGVADDQLAVELHAIMARCGGVTDVRHAGRLAALVEGEDRLGGRLTLLEVVRQSSQEVLRLFVQGSGLRTLESWVVQYRDEGKHSAVVKVMECLKRLPVDLSALRGSSIGQTVGKLRKHAQAEVRTAASALVDQWKSVVDRSVGKGDARQGLRSKSDGSGNEGPNKRAKKAEPSSAPAAAAAGGSATSGAAGSGAGTNSNSTTSKLAVMDDDLFVASPPAGAAPHGGGPHGPAGQHRPMGLTSFISNVKKVHAVKLENVVPGRPGAAAASQSGAAGVDGAADALPSPTGAGPLSPTSSGDAAAAADGSTSGSGDAGGASGSGPESPKPGADGVPASEGGAAGSAPSVPKPVSLPRLGTLAGPSTPTVRLGSLRDGSLPTTSIARLGAAAGSGGRAGTAASLPAAVAPGGPQSAHARAMAARARAPSPEPAPRKEKRKTVSWAVDDALASFRLFKKDDPPQLASADAVLTAEDEAGVGPGGVQHQPPGFQSAARREHASEREALFAQHQQEEQERQMEMERWNAMRPTVPWVEPPELFMGNVQPQQLPALGDESTEREVQALARQRTPRAMYRSPQHVPPSPAEPPPEPEPDMHHRPVLIPLNVPSQAPGMGGPPGGAR